MKFSSLILAGLILTFSLIFSLIALNQHYTFQTHGFDLGNVNQAIWQTAQGHPFAFTNMAPLTSRLALHVEPILLLLTPFYWMGFGDAAFLLVIQAVSVVLGTWPLYLIAKSDLGDLAALIICLAYLLYPTLEAAVFYEFHAVTLAPTFFLAAIYNLERAMSFAQNKGGLNYRRTAIILMSLFLVLALACKEDMGLTAAFFGLYLGLKHQRWALAGGIFVLGLIWTGLCLFVIQPQFATGGNIQAERYTWLTQAPVLTWPGLMLTHLQEINLGRYFMALFAPVSGLALLSPLCLLPTLPTLAINLLSSNPFTWRAESFHYGAPLAPFIFLGTIYSLKKLRQGSKSLYLLGLSLLLLSTLWYHYFRGFTPLARPFQWHRVTAHHRLGWDIAAQIAPDIPLFAPLTLNPHVSNRPQLHQEFTAISPNDWLWLDVATLPNADGIQSYIQEVLLPYYQIIKAQDGYLLLQPQEKEDPTTTRGARPLSPQFYTFTRPEQPPQYQLEVEFNQALVFVGYDLLFKREEEVRVRAYWQAHQPLPPDLQFTLYLLDEKGHPLGSTDPKHPPATLVWLPPRTWPLHETIVMDFNDTHIAWHTHDRSHYQLAIGLSISSDPWDIGSRWRPENAFQRDNPFMSEPVIAPYLAADGTLLELAQIIKRLSIPEGRPTYRHMVAPKVDTPTPFTFAAQIRLWGYDAPQIQRKGETDEIQLKLVWQAIESDIQDYVRFVHVLGPTGLQGQLDSRPVDGRYPTAGWIAGEFIQETISIALPTNKPAGPHTLHLGFYDPNTGQRLYHEGGDYVAINTSTTK